MEEKIKLFNREKVMGSPMPARKSNSSPDEVVKMNEMVAELIKANADTINNSKNKNSQLKKVNEAINSYESSLLSGNQNKIKKAKEAYEKAFKDFEKGLKPVIKEIGIKGGFNFNQAQVAVSAAAKLKEIIERGRKTHMEQATRPSEGIGLGKQYLQFILTAILANFLLFYKNKL